MPLQINATTINALTSDKELKQIAWQATKDHHRKAMSGKAVAALVLGSLTGVGLFITAPASAIILIKAYRSYREALRLSREARNHFVVTQVMPGALPEDQAHAVAHAVAHGAQARNQQPAQELLELPNEGTPLLAGAPAAAAAQPAAPAAQPEPAAPSALHVNPFFKKHLDRQIVELETQLKNGKWQYAPNPESYLAALVELENAKKPGLNLVHCDNPRELARQIARCIDEGIPKAQFLVKDYDRVLNHTIAVSYQLVGDKPSVLAFESSNFECGGDALPLHYNIKEALKNTLKSINFGNISMTVQNSDNQYGLFALNIAKQNWRHPEGIDALHKRHIKGDFVGHRLRLDNQYVNTDNILDIAHLLPVRLLKHSQSGTRIGDHIANNPNLSREVVNKKGETLAQYRARHTRMAITDEMFRQPVEKQLNASMYHKQLAYMKEVAAAVTVVEEPNAQ